MEAEKRVKLLWCCFVACLVGMVVMRIAMEMQVVEYEEVEVRVISAETRRIVNRRTKTNSEIYEVKVAYKGEVYKLGNAFKSSHYREGEYVKAYASNGRLFANIEGVSTSTLVAKIYFACLFGSFGLLIAALYNTGIVKQQKIASNQKEDE